MSELIAIKVTTEIFRVMVDFTDIVHEYGRGSRFLSYYLQINKRNTGEVSFFKIIKLICSERFMIFFVVFPEFRFLKF